MHLRQLLFPLVDWEGVVAAQRVRCGALDAWFTHFPLLGNESQFVLVLPFLGMKLCCSCSSFFPFRSPHPPPPLPSSCTVAWCCGAGGSEACRHFALLSFVTCALNNGAKELLKLPRPPPRLHVVNSDTKTIVEQYGFPSTHSAHAISLAWVVARFAVSSGAIGWRSAVALAALHVRCYIFFVLWCD